MKKYNLINNLLGWLCFVIAAVTYLMTIEPTASFWDCPEFIAQGAKLEVGHPPGNPIFMLTARFFVTIFGGDITNAAIAVNSMSALLSAATILLLFWTITHFVKRLVVRDDAQSVTLPQMIAIMGAGLCGALAYTWSDTFWFSAVEGEVYAFSSFCTALVIWLILKWENRADDPDSDRYLVLIAYVIGVSIAVHLLNLLCIPAIVLVFYYRKYKDVNAKGSLIALGVSVVLVALTLYGLVPGFVKVAQAFELLFVNTFGFGYNSGVIAYGIVLVAVFVYTIYALYTQSQALGAKLGVLAVLMLSGLTFMTSHVWVWVTLVIGAAVYLFAFCRKIPYRIFNVSILSILVIFIGYSSYALLLIRASANTPMNQNAPDNVFALSSYLNREQYGKNPLLYGPIFAEKLDMDYYEMDDGSVIGVVPVDENGIPRVTTAESTLSNRKVKDGYVTREPIDNGEYKYTKVAKSSPDDPDKYVLKSYTTDYANNPDLNMLFTRMYSYDPTHIKGYKNWSGYENTDILNLRARVPNSKLDEWAQRGYVTDREIGFYLTNLEPVRKYANSGETENVWKPSFIDNLRYFFNYQLNHMYWRYFMWNFAGRQNDIQGNGEPHQGNWISGIPLIDNLRLGDQSLLPDEYGKDNKGHNVFYMLPLLLGILGLLWQSMVHHRANTPLRGIEQFWVVFFLFFMTGIAIVLYLNQTPGQPRERDYAFAGSFYAFAIWVGMGVPAIWWGLQRIFDRDGRRQSVKTAGKGSAGHFETPAPSSSMPLATSVVAAVIGLIVPLQMVSQTWDDHDRSHRYTTHDFGENYLNSLGENAIIFTNGDNDTFPLWYAQEVEGKRLDVKVVNLSYLATDWYANQIRYPYYDAPGVKMLAKPSDYAYDRLAWSVNDPSGAAIDDYTALGTLQRFYDSDNEMTYGNLKIKKLDTYDLYSPIDTAAVMRAFDIDPNSSDSITKIPYISDISMPGLRGSGFALNKLLSFDIVANTINDGFERPVYFASTVPDEYYLGLQPYLYSTGIANQVTPFANAEVSPMADKAYENIVSRFRWGGLDDERYNHGLYLDETVRRMVATHRNAMVDLAEALFINGKLPATDFAVQWAKDNSLPVPRDRFDMAHYILQLMEEKLPAEVTPYDPSTEMILLNLYLNLYDVTGNADDLAKAERMIQQGLDRYAQLARYAVALGDNGYGGIDSYRIDNMGYTAQLARYHLPLFIGYKNYVDLLKALKAKPGAYETYLADFPIASMPELRVQVLPYLYFVDLPTSEISEIANESPRYSDFAVGAKLAEAHEAAGIDRMAVTREVLDRYGLDIDQLIRINPYVHK